MVKASPIVRAFNAGVFSVLMEGRTDVDRYPSSLRRGFNVIAAQQGPAICRSGTEFRQPVRLESGKGILIPFEFAKDQALMLEFSGGRVRFHDSGGVLTQTPAAITSVTDNDPVTFVSAALSGVSVGDSVALSDFPFEFGINGSVGKVVTKVGTTYTLDISYPNASTTAPDAKAAKVYEVVHPYTTEAELLAVRYQQEVDSLFLQNGGRLRTLSRYGLYDWRFAELETIDGPFMPEDMESGTVLVPATTGNAATNATGTGTGGTNPSNAFDEDPSTSWTSTANQTGVLTFTPTVPFVATGYYLAAIRNSTNASYSPVDQAPGTWSFEGFNGSTWVQLDAKADFQLYDSGRTPYIRINNKTAYSAYRLNILACTRNGTISPTLSAFVISSEAAASIVVNASSVDGINNGQGFLSTDVGRAIRMKASDGLWRDGIITARSSTTSITVKLDNGPFCSTSCRATSWRLGYWSDTTGWPTCALFFDDRLWFGGCSSFPDVMASTIVGGYSPTRLDMSPTDDTGAVLAESGIVIRLNSSKLGAVQWIETDEKGLLIGTLNGEWVISQVTSGAALSATNVQARNSTKRGSAAVDAVKIDRQVLFLQRGKRNVYEFAFNYEADGYKAPLMSVYASHLMRAHGGLEQIVYMAEPNSLVWARAADGWLLSLTYNRDENVIAWFEHEIAGGVVEWIETMPAPDAARDDLWLIVRRTINGQTRRYVEKLKPFWDEEMTKEDAFFVDCGLRYVGDPISRVCGLSHLEGEEVMLLADGVPDGPFTVTDGCVDLTVSASNIVAGIGFESEGETARIEAGAADGTAQGKLKRMPKVGVYLWSSLGGEIGVFDENAVDEETGVVGKVVYSPIPYSDAPFNVVEEAALRTEEVDVPVAEGWNKRGTIWFRRPATSPLPLNIVRYTPRMITQDG